MGNFRLFRRIKIAPGVTINLSKSEVEFNQLANIRPFDTHVARVEVLRSLGTIEGRARPEKQADSWPTVNLQALRRPDAFKEFTALFDDLVRQIREAKAAGT